MIFETERLIVRPWTATDAETAFAIYRDPEVTRYLGGNRTHADLGASRAWLARLAERNAALPVGLGLWAVTIPDGDRPIGLFVLAPLDGGPEIEIGYHLGRDWWGRGYATELARGGLRYGFERLGLPRIVGVTFPENVASRRVLTKVGLRPAGRGRYYGHDLDYFALDAADYRGAAGD